MLHSWVLSCQGHSSSKPLSLDDRSPLFGSWDTSVHSSPHGIQACTASYRGYRSSQSHMPGRTHPQESRAGSACSAHSCICTEIRNNQQDRDPHSSCPDSQGCSCNAHQEGCSSHAGSHNDVGTMAPKTQPCTHTCLSLGHRVRGGRCI